MSLCLATRGNLHPGLGKATRGVECVVLPASVRVPSFYADQWRAFFEADNIKNVFDDVSSNMLIGVERVKNEIEINQWSTILEYGMLNTFQYSQNNSFECADNECSIDVDSGNIFELHSHRGIFEVKND